MTRGYHPPVERDDWGTPLDLFAELEQEFGPFYLDAAASPENALCPSFYSVEDNALRRPWYGRVFCNPPYGRELGKWVRKAQDEVDKEHAEVVVMLLPAYTSVSWFHDVIWCVEPVNITVRFLRGRLKFRGAKHPAPFASMIVVFK